jgi:hypothetical protein
MISPFNYVNRLICMSLLVMLLSDSALSQEPQPAQLPHGGTLNLLFANKNGFVIAADSRRTYRLSRSYHDDSQKLFRIGPQSAMVIAGFATWMWPGSPLDIQVASVLREDLMDDKWLSGERTILELPNQIKGGLGYQLGALGALLGTYSPPMPLDSLNFQFMAAEIASTGQIQIVTGTFNPTIQKLGALGVSMPSYNLTPEARIVEGFIALAAGQRKVATAILQGNFATKDPRILNYYRNRIGGRLDDLSLSGLEELAIAIMAETNRATPLVGGPNQIGVFGRDGNVKWNLPPMATDRQKLHSTILKAGFPYGYDKLGSGEVLDGGGEKAELKMYVSLYQPFEQDLIQIFIGNQFRNVRVLLDGNVFAANEFKHVKFLYRGERVYFVNNTLDDCVVETLVGIQLPAQLRVCRQEEKSTLDIRNVIGAPTRPEPTGCVRRNADGKLVLKTDGWEDGKACKDSGFKIPKIWP